MIRSAKLPFLPGYNFSREVGQTRFHKSTQFEYLRGLIPYLSEASRPGFGGYPLTWETPDTTPSLYPRRECKELPGWIAFDKQILTFEAYFQETMWEVHKSPYQLRKVKIYYFLEDGTIQVIEPAVDNSGINQGVLIARQRIRFPKPMDHAFYDMIDFNIGKNVELYGKVFRIVNCDKFTRNFLNRMGIFVGDPLNYPTDLHRIEEEKKKIGNLGKKPRRVPAVLGRYLEYDKKVLRFYGYWDDRPSQYGYIHKLEVHFFLADNTIEIQEIVPPNSGIDSGCIFLKRSKLPKFFEKLPFPGDEETASLLNIWPTGFLKGRYIIDPISSASFVPSYYEENDLAIGVALNVFGRKIILTDCDEFTKEYYRSKYGIDSFNALPTPDDGTVILTKEKDLPPWNGFGTFEDSEVNCKKVILEAPKKDLYKLLVKGRMGIDSHVLRFKAKMISVDSINDDRTFIVSYYLADDQLSVFERAARNSGFESRYFSKKREFFKPDQEMFVSVKPETFNKNDLWIGNVIKLEGFNFKLISADEYCLRYMELHKQEFPKSNAKLILEKLREKVRPIYKEFVSNCLNPCLENFDESTSVISFCNLKRVLGNLFDADITEQEIITLARYFRFSVPSHASAKNHVINVCRTECRRKLWLGLNRLRENLYNYDPCCTGFVSKKVALSLCKGAKIPIIGDLLNTVLNVVCKNECGEISIEDLINFFDTENGAYVIPVAPFSISHEFSEITQMKQDVDYSWIDYNSLLQNIELEEEVINDTTVPLLNQTQTSA